MGSNKHPYFFFYDEGSTYRYGWGFKLWKVHIVNQSSFSPKYHLQVSFLCWKLSFKTCSVFLQDFHCDFHQHLPFSVMSLKLTFSHFPWKEQGMRRWKFLKSKLFFIQKRDLCLNANFLFYAHHKWNLENLVTWHCLIWIKALILLLLCGIYYVALDLIGVIKLV